MVSTQISTRVLTPSRNNSPRLLSRLAVRQGGDFGRLSDFQSLGLLMTEPAKTHRMRSFLFHWNTRASDNLEMRYSIFSPRNIKSVWSSWTASIASAFSHETHNTTRRFLKH